ncbi:hypothetical protein OG604_48105 [Streptomyces sp. NBC_01231]|nr:hypothetical protein OG604_48105 [Streptomyces sp. NBC_01231]
MTARPRTRLNRVRASAGIAKLALQQIEDELTSDIDAQELAEVLRELHHEDHRQAGVFGSLAQSRLDLDHYLEALVKQARRFPRRDCPGTGPLRGQVHPGP